MADIILPGGAVYRYDDGEGAWRHIPDVDTANAMGVDWNNLDAEDSLPGPTGDDFPSVDAPTYTQSPTSTSPPGGILDIEIPGGAIYRYDPSSGQWRHIPDVATANAMGVDWNNLDAESGLPGAVGPDWPELGAPPSSGGGGAAAPPASGGGELGGSEGQIPTDSDGLSDDQVLNSLFQAYSSDVPAPVTILPAQAWDSLRDTMVNDVPFVGQHVRAQGNSLGNVLASDLWSSST